MARACCLVVCRARAEERSAWVAFEVPRRVILGCVGGDVGWEDGRVVIVESGVEPSFSGRRILEATSTFWRVGGTSRSVLRIEERSESVASDGSVNVRSFAWYVIVISRLSDGTSEGS